MSASRGHLADGLLYGQITDTGASADIASAIGTRGRVVLEAGVGQQVGQTVGAHQVAVGTLQRGRASVKVMCDEDG